MRRLQLGTNLLRLTKLRQCPLERLLLGQPRSLVLGQGVEQMFRTRRTTEAGPHPELEAWIEPNRIARTSLERQDFQLSHLFLTPTVPVHTWVVPVRSSIHKG